MKQFEVLEVVTIGGNELEVGSTVELDAASEEVTAAVEAGQLKEVGTSTDEEAE